MIRTIKYTAIIIVCGTMIYLITRVERCGKGGTPSQTIEVPSDSNFAPIVKQEYTPPSLPFIKGRMKGKLPKGIGERDVKKITDITLSNKPKKDETISIIETKNGNIFVAKDSSVKSVTVIEFEPPIMSLQIGFGAGLSLDYKCKRISPAAIFAPIEWIGWLHIPVVSADLDGVGLGAQARVYHNIFVGAANHWRYDSGTQVKFLLTYNF